MTRLGQNGIEGQTIKKTQHSHPLVRRTSNVPERTVGTIKEMMKRSERISIDVPKIRRQNYTRARPVRPANRKGGHLNDEQLEAERRRKNGNRDRVCHGTDDIVRTCCWRRTRKGARATESTTT